MIFSLPELGESPSPVSVLSMVDWLRLYTPWGVHFAGVQGCTSTSIARIVNASLVLHNASDKHCAGFPWAHGPEDFGPGPMGTLRCNERLKFSAVAKLPNTEAIQEK